MINLTEQEVLVLWRVAQGDDTPESIGKSLEIKETEAKASLANLNDLELIDLKVLYDNRFQMEYCVIHLKDKAKYFFRKYKSLIPKQGAN